MQEDQSQILSRLARLEARQKFRGVLVLLLLGALALVGIAGEEEEKPAVESIVLRDENGKVLFEVRTANGGVLMSLQSDTGEAGAILGVGPGSKGPVLSMVGNPELLMTKYGTGYLKIAFEDRAGGVLVLDGKSAEARAKVWFGHGGVSLQLVDPEVEQPFVFQGDQRSAAGRIRAARARCKRYHNAVLLLGPRKGKPVERLTELEEPLDGRPFHSLMTDPWGAEYRLDKRAGVPTVVSNGPDGLANTKDDISYPPR